MLNVKTKIGLIAAGLVAAAGQTQAVDFTATSFMYAVEEVQSDSTVLTVPAGAAIAQYQVGGGLLQIGNVIEFTLTGAEFASLPGLSCGTPASCAGTSFIPFLASPTKVQYTVQNANITGVTTLRLGSFTLTKASTRLGAVNPCTAAANSVTITASGSTSVGEQPSGSGPLLTSCNASATVITPVSDTAIDVASGGLNFLPTAASSSTQALVGFFTTQLTPGVRYADGTLVTATELDLSNLTVSAEFAGMSGMSVKTTCTAAGANIATSSAPSAGMVSFTNVPTPTSGLPYCLYANASTTTPMFSSTGVNNTANTFAVTAGSTIYDTLPRTTLWITPAKLGTLPLNGAAAAVQYVVSANSNYNNYVAVTNPSFVPAQVYAAMVTYGLNGNPAGIVSTGPVGTIPANGGLLLNSAQIAAATGGLLPSGEAARVIFFSSADAIDASNMLLNSGNIVSGIR